MSDLIDVSCTTAGGELFVGAETMHRKAFAVMDVTPLWLGPAQRGSNLMIPGLSGRIAFPKRGDETSHSLRMLLDGRYTVAGAATADYNQGLYDIVKWLNTYVANPTVGHTLTLYEPDGTGTVTGLGQLSLEVGDRAGPLQRALLTVILPYGQLT